MKKIILLIIIAAFVVFLWLSVPGSGLAPGKDAPDFTLTDLNGRQVSLNSFRGKVVFLNFWSYDCMPCRMEMSSMQSLNGSLNQNDFQMIAVSVDEDRAAVKEFVGAHGFNFMILMDRDAGVSRTYGVFKYPETYVIGREGKIIKRFIGGEDWSSDRFQKYFQSLIRN